MVLVETSMSTWRMEVDLQRVRLSVAFTIIWKWWWDGEGEARERGGKGEGKGRDKYLILWPGLNFGVTLLPSPRRIS
jgi:hypothetical protein